jgi:hypothetical protein
MPTFDTNLRRIRMTETGRWTLMTDKDRAKAIHLCDFCAINSMCITQQRLASIVTEFEVGAVISECPGYRPHLSFRDEIGLDGNFNTVRLGKAWADRLREGALVTLWNSIKDREIGVAKVKSCIVGPWQDVAPKHAHRNHTQVDQPREGAEDRLYEILRKGYGPHLMKPDRLVTAIYLEREHGA